MLAGDPYQDNAVAADKQNNESINSPTRIITNNANINNNNKTSNNGSHFNNLLNSQHRHSPAVSPQILRRTLYKLDKQQKEKNKKFQLLDERKSSGSGDWISTGGSTSSSVESPLFGTRFAFMEGKISRFQLKRLKIKQQALLEHGVWKSAENGVWRATNGNEVKLVDRRVGFFTTLERQVLEKIVMSRLQKMNLGCAIVKPKESLPLRQRRLKYNRRKAQTVNVIDKKKMSDTKSPMQGGQQVFGVPLSQCVEYEQSTAYEQQLQSQPIRTSQVPYYHHRRNYEVHKMSADQVLLYPSASAAHLPFAAPSSARENLIFKYNSNQQRDHRSSGSSYSTPSCSRLPSTSTYVAAGKYTSQKLSDSQLLLEPIFGRQETGETFYVDQKDASHAQCEQLAKLSLSDRGSMESSPSYAAKLCSSRSSVYTSQEDSPFMDKQHGLSSDSLFGGCCSPSSKSDSSLFNMEPEIKRVPRIVQTCTDYLKEYGLQTIGLFRVAGSAKRCRQLKLELDSGQEVVFVDEETDVYPHDVATLLKEYFRDLPDPLLTKELYPCFVAAARLPEGTFLEVLQYLVYLLPTANCDTLLVLLQFLNQVSSRSDDFVDENGVLISGNKMNVKNLATVFGPTILRPGSSNPTKISQNLSDNDSVIRVVEAMIDNCDKLFMVSSNIQDIIYKHIQDTDPDALDTILTQLWNNQSSEDANKQKASVFVSTEEKVSPDVITREADGSTTVTTRKHTTHRIVYSTRHGIVTDTLDEEFNAPFGGGGDSSSSRLICDRILADELDDSTSGKGSSIISSEPGGSAALHVDITEKTLAPDDSGRFLRVLSTSPHSQNISSSSSETHLNGPSSESGAVGDVHFPKSGRNSSLASGSSEEVLNLTSGGGASSHQHGKYSLNVFPSLEKISAPANHKQTLVTGALGNLQRKNAMPMRKITPIAKLTEVMRFGAKKN